MSILYTIFGFILRLCYEVCSNNFVLALVLFTLIAKLLMLPMAFSQQKNSVKMQKMKPEMDEIRKKYANNQQKQQEEMQKLYDRHGYKMTAGCLPMLIQFPIIMGLYGVIYAPMTYVLQKTGTEVVEAAKRVLPSLGEGKARELVEAVTNTAPAEYSSNVGRGAEIVIAKADQLMDFDLFGLIDLSETPSLKVFGWLWLIPLFVGVSQILASFISMKMSGQEMNGSTKIMVFGMPILTVVFAFQFPGAIGFYWILNSILQVGQSFLVRKLYSPERAEKRELARREKERAEKLDRLRRLHGDDEEPSAPTAATPAQKLTIKDDPSARKDDVDLPAQEKPELSKKQKKQQDRDRLRDSRKGH